MARSGLGSKITATLIIMSIISVIASTLFMLVITKQQFSDYIDQNNQVIASQWAPLISDYYSQNGFAGLQEYLLSARAGNGMGRSMGMGQHQRLMLSVMGMQQGQRLIVADNSNIVIADTQGDLIGQTADFNSLHVTSSSLKENDNPIGTLYIISPLSSNLSSLEKTFISNLTVNAGILAFIMGLIALILGLVLGRRITSPISTLSDGIHKLAKGNLNERINLQGDKEFIELGQDFNLMAQKLEDADKNRRRLTADISHELRTPLTLIRGQLEGIQSGFTPMNSENLTLVVDEVIRLSRLVKELENLSLAESHALSLHVSSSPAANLIERLTPVIMAMQDKGIQFTIDIGEDVKEIKADQDKLLQILLNLLSNSLHHVKNEGLVTLSIFRQSDCLQFAVADNGPGISPEDLPHVFDRFYRVDDSRNRREGGMGLGLAIAKAYTEAHNGKMWVESTIGSGTAFYFILPQ